jgi:hypothetical protein
MPRQPLFLLLFAPLVYLTLCACVAGLLAYPLYLLLPDGLVGFNTLVSRGAEFILAFGLFPLGRWLGVGKPDIGMALSSATFRRYLFKGFGYGALMLGLHSLLLLAIDVRLLHPDPIEIIRLLRLAGKGLLIGLAVSAIEEPVFRGFLLGSLAQRTSRMNAVFISALYFAGLHFLDSDLRPATGDIHWNSGLVIVTDAFAKFGGIEFNSFLALFTAGAFLACIRLTDFNSSLPFCMGIHAGWVFIIKTAKPFTHVNADSSLAWLVSHFDGFIGHLSSAWISVLIAMLAWHIAQKIPQR